MLSKTLWNCLPDIACGGEDVSKPCVHHVLQVLAGQPTHIFDQGAGLSIASDIIFVAFQGWCHSVEYATDSLALPTGSSSIFQLTQDDAVDTYDGVQLCAHGGEHRELCFFDKLCQKDVFEHFQVLQVADFSRLHREGNDASGVVAETSSCAVAEPSTFLATHYRLNDSHDLRAVLCCALHARTQRHASPVQEDGRSAR